jgi:hypothetical protein
MTDEPSGAAGNDKQPWARDGIKPAEQGGQPNLSTGQ